MTDLLRPPTPTIRNFLFTKIFNFHQIDDLWISFVHSLINMWRRLWYKQLYNTNHDQKKQMDKEKKRNPVKNYNTLRLSAFHYTQLLNKAKIRQHVNLKYKKNTLIKWQTCYVYQATRLYYSHV